MTPQRKRDLLLCFAAARLVLFLALGVRGVLEQLPWVFPVISFLVATLAASDLITRLRTPPAKE